MGRPHALSGKEDRLRKERRRTQQREWVRNRRKATVASTSTASSASDSLAKEEHINRLESQRREQNQRCKGRRRANATDDDLPGCDGEVLEGVCREPVWRHVRHISAISGMSGEKKRETGAYALRQCIEYSSAGAVVVSYGERAGKVVFPFLRRVELANSKAQFIVDAVKMCLVWFRIDLHKMVGIGTENASVMVGVNNGLYQKLKMEVLNLLANLGYEVEKTLQDPRKAGFSGESKRELGGRCIALPSHLVKWLQQRLLDDVRMPRQVERVFCQMNIVKSTQRNRMSTEMTNAIVTVRAGLQREDK
ncbi:hypothetical protein HPB47_024098 [Ixodes persulcatus]|uniref:Uncharacterized protein n=1 Tax=Ixodes persulcatus TaxID=34615 RepID=A0AC60Q5H1_IXOPE|nr:hypothetical protein HPB47_024098 [Ixodes persulcatus]